MDRRSARMPRSDARQNRERILTVARQTFATAGLEVTMREVARRAQLGVATLYRHFPTRDDLIVATFAEQVRVCVATVAAAAEDPDAWRGVRAVVDEVCTRQALDRGFTAALLGTEATRRLFEAERAQNLRAVARLVDRARQEGAVRPDLTVADFRLVLAATGAPGLSGLAPEQAVLEVRRLAAILLQGIRADPSTALLPLPAREGGDH